MQQVTIVTGLGYGDEGKGSAVDALARRLPSPPVVVRHNGGPQAAHNVVLPDGREHTFAQWGSATFAGGRTHLSQHMLINPLNMPPEAEHLRSQGVSDPFGSLTVAAGAKIITPYHVAMNRAREAARGNERHGSCGQGVGELRQDMISLPSEAIEVADLQSFDYFMEKLEFWRYLKWDEVIQLFPDVNQMLRKTYVAEALSRTFTQDTFSHYCDQYRAIAEQLTIVPNDYVQDLLEQGEYLIFEGAQGVLLDEWYGFHPYTTWSDTTTHNAIDLLGDFDRDKILSLGVIRSYGTRHGPGPFVTESPFWQPPEPHNGTGEWQGMFRTGWFDVPAFKYALRIAGPIDGMILTHVDTIQRCQGFPICIAYEWPDRFSVSGAFSTPEIKVNPHLPGDDKFLDWQEKLTKEIMVAEPVYEAREWQAFATSECLNAVPLYMKSCGPTHEDKVFC